MIRSSFLVIGLFTLLLSCKNQPNESYKEWSDCPNFFKLIRSEQAHPILEFEMDWPPDTLGDLIQNLYAYDLCSQCTDALVNVNFPIYGKVVPVKMVKPFDFECCEGCPIPMLKKSFCDIIINNKDLLLVKGRRIEENQLDTLINNYLVDDKYMKKLFYIKWQQGTSREILDRVMLKIVTAYALTCEKKLEKELCSATVEEIIKVKNDFALDIIFGQCSSRILDIDEVSNLK